MKIKSVALGNKHDIQIGKSQYEQLDNKMRLKNVTFDGIPEEQDENLKQKIFDLIVAELADFTEARIKSAYRLGVARGKKPRTVLVILDDETIREKLLSNAIGIKERAKNKYLWINRDQNDTSRRKYGLLKACYKLLPENAHPCSLKGNNISLNGKKYSYDELNLLPENCRPENVKSRVIDEGTGLAFSSEHVFCSNFAHSLFIYKISCTPR